MYAKSMRNWISVISMLSKKINILLNVVDVVKLEQCIQRWSAYSAAKIKLWNDLSYSV